MILNTNNKPTHRQHQSVLSRVHKIKLRHYEKIRSKNMDDLRKIKAIIQSWTASIEADIDTIA